MIVSIRFHRELEDLKLVARRLCARRAEARSASAWNFYRSNGSNLAIWRISNHLPSGKRLHMERSTIFFMGNSTISTGPFSMSLFVCMFSRPGRWFSHSISMPIKIIGEIPLPWFPEAKSVNFENHLQADNGPTTAFFEAPRKYWTLPLPKFFQATLKKQKLGTQCRRPSYTHNSKCVCPEKCDTPQSAVFEGKIMSKTMEMIFSEHVPTTPSHIVGHISYIP